MSCGSIGVNGALLVVVDVDADVDVDVDVDGDVDVDEDGALTRDTCIADLKIRGLNTAPTRALVMLPTPHMSHAETADLICPSSSGIQLQ